ncbi:hypothetical protein D7Y15_36555 [Corallococcus sp. AB030]|uniref:hypothetical protein n=1 Tax=Corallococcus TaxID=83461 RepID=UPI000EDDA56A|nr:MULTISPECIES: hypothetical protein [unclassified Corallococcus]RKI01124.1 hypothetical protein D7Y15_36555 [Corallococcus sp. AB030]RUO88751.1 hypothetical protein D7Y11_33790 [Corallococcus sp. AB018]
MKSLLVGMMLASTLGAGPSKTVDLVGTVHSEDIGNQSSSRATWLPTQPKRIEQFEFHLKRPMKAVQLEYQCHLQDTGDSGWLPEGTPCGTQGESRRLEAFGIRLRGEGAHLYTVRYWCKVEGMERPLGPLTDGAMCGTTGEGRKLLGMQVELVRK